MSTPSAPSPIPNGRGKSGWTLWHTLGLLGLLVAMTAVGLTSPSWGGTPLLVWLITMGLMAVCLAVTGDGVMKRWLGALIDERNRLSLSRLQMTAWTLVILSGLFTAAIHNATVLAGEHSASQMLSIVIPNHLWLMMGISTTALIGSPLLRSTKKGRDPDPDETQTTMTSIAKQRGWSQAAADDRLTTQGQIVCNTNAVDAQFSDLFKGEEVGNAAHLDMARVQMFFFTVILVVAYAVALGSLFANLAPTASFTAFPDIDPSMVTVLGISNAGYLVNKAIPNSQEAGPDTGGSQTPAAPNS